MDGDYNDNQQIEFRGYSGNIVGGESSSWLSEAVGFQVVLVKAIQEKLMAPDPADIPDNLQSDDKVKGFSSTSPIMIANIQSLNDV